MERVRTFLKVKGFHFDTLSGWLYFFMRCGEFLKKYRGRVFATIKEKVRTMPVSQMTIQEMRRHQDICKKTEYRYNELVKLKWTIPTLRDQPRFCVLICVTQGNRVLDDLLDDLDKQIYPPHQVVLFRENFSDKKPEPAYDPEETSSTRLQEQLVLEGLKQAIAAAADSDYLLFLQEGDRILRQSLFELALELNQRGDRPTVLYTDHDCQMENLRGEPYFKPNWSPDLFLVTDYIKRAFIVSQQALTGWEPSKQPLSYSMFCYELLLRVSESGTMAHLPGALITLKHDFYEEDYSEPRNQLRQEALHRRGSDAKVGENAYCNTMIRRKVQNHPKVSIIIPTCYKGDFVQRCLTSIEKITTYSNYEVIVIDNSRRSPRYGEKLLKNYRCSILYCNEPFNWARLNNLAAAQATGDFLMFLNDDTEIITPNWLETLLADAQRADVAMVGPLLLFPNGTVQSAGVFLVNHGGGGRSFFLNEPEDSRVYHDFLHYQRECSFVIGACIMLERKKFNAVNGFDESFALVGNEMDLGLRLRQAGYRNLYQPDVKLIHKEKASRSSMSETAGDRHIWKVWGAKLELCDEYFNPYLDDYSNTPMEDSDPVRAMLVGSPTLTPEHIHKILLVKLDHIGDDIISLPAIRKLRSLFPDAQIDLLCGPWAKGMMSAQPEIDRVLTYEFFSARSQLGVTGSSQKEVLKLIRKLRLEHYDLSVHLRRHEETQGIAAESADYCLSFSTRPVEDPISHAVPMLTDIGFHRPKWSMHDQLLMLVNTLQYEPELDRELHIPAEEEAAAAAFAASIPQFSAKLRIGIHAGAGGDFKQWNPQYFARLCNLILEKTDASIILFGGKDELPINAIILKEVQQPERVVDVAGKQSLLGYCALVKYVDYFIGNDSGPKHIAGIQGVPTLTINGSTSEQEWSSPGVKAMSVRRIMGCCPCYYYMAQQCSEHKCLNRLGPGAVFCGLKRLMLLYPTEKGGTNQ